MPNHAFAIVGRGGIMVIVAVVRQETMKSVKKKKNCVCVCVGGEIDNGRSTVGQIILM